MPKPNAGESRDAYMERCVPQVLDDGAAADQDQAVAMCSSMWGEAKGTQAVVHRAYGLLQLKRIDEQQRILSGIATTPTPDRMGDIVEPLGARFSLPIPLLYQHASALPVGEVFEARATKDGIAVNARIFKAAESRTLKERLDEAWESVKIGLLKGFSIGFAPIGPPEQTKDFSYRYKTWEWLELSLVTIPANAEATISTVKSLDRQWRAASGQRPGVVRLDSETLRRVRRELQPGVVYLKSGDGR